jgi:hypothetical protein
LLVLGLEEKPAGGGFWMIKFNQAGADGYTLKTGLGGMNVVKSDVGSHLADYAV